MSVHTVWEHACVCVLWERTKHEIAGHLRTAPNDCLHYRPPSVLNKLRWSTNCDLQDTVRHSNGHWHHDISFEDDEIVIMKLNASSDLWRGRDHWRWSFKSYQEHSHWQLVSYNWLNIPILVQIQDHIVRQDDKWAITYNFSISQKWSL